MTAPVKVVDEGPDEPQSFIDAVVENASQYAHIGGAAFAFYEDRTLCACSLVGYVGLAVGVAVLSVGGFVPTMGERLWRFAIPVCGILAVVTSVGCRLLHSYFAGCAALFVVNLAVTLLIVRGDKDAKRRQ
eukprot:TRINITY_DN71724_c0_g1_i1.p1 TRINITY_DN71724_c0_g1~~TRINITY_DN71724_c0_g1_i1.p1  ORF type:complete len:131 (-),score=9.32 TRINITY_DN71724_c0_g1_i1:202-594(-)